jgi:hypothetical protein
MGRSERQKSIRSVVRPVGDPLGWTPGQVDALANVSDADKFDAVAYWRRRAPSRYRELLDARPRRKAAG